MGLIKGALKASIVVKLVDVVRREAAKPENQRKARELVGRVRQEAAKPANQRKIKGALNKLSSRTNKSPRTH